MNQTSSSDVVYNPCKDLDRLSRLALKISNSASCLIFLPVEIFSGKIAEGRFSGLLQLGGQATLQGELNEKHRVKAGIGVVGWTAKNKKPSNICSFRNSSGTLGFYNNELNIGSLCTVPIDLSFIRKDWQEEPLAGVLYCDSDAENIYDDSVTGLLETIAEEAAQIVALSCKVNASVANNLNFHEFHGRVLSLTEQIGSDSLEIMRIKMQNSEELELHLGLSKFVILFESMQRLIQQVLPPQYPVVHLPNGETLIVLDNMLGNFYENKIRMIAAHVGPDNLAINYTFNRKILKVGRDRNSSMDIFNFDSGNEPLSLLNKLKLKIR